MCLFLVPDPAEVGIVIASEAQPATDPTDESIRWIDALCAPKVALYGLSYFCIKFSIYAILLWMPICLN